MQNPSASTHLTTGDLARLYDVPAWLIRRLADRRQIPTPLRVGLYRVFSESDLPAIEAALIEAGYIRPGEAAHA